MHLQSTARTRTRRIGPSAAIFERAERSIDAAAGWSLTNQNDDGSWVGQLESNTTIEAEWILALHLLGIDDQEKVDALARGLLDRQRDDGSWDIYHGAPAGDINATVESYVALRAAGYAADDPRMKTAREWIFAAGGLQRVRVFTRYWLAMIGLWPWSATPTLPPELILLPRFSPIHLYSFASWARATIVPLAILSARRPVKPLPDACQPDELFPEGRETFDFTMQVRAIPGSVAWFFKVADRLLARYVNFPIRPGRESAIKLCLEWIVKHQDADGGFGGIQPPWIYGLLALKGEGYSLDHPVIAQGLAAFDHRWSYRRGDSLLTQASDSVVWDTALMLIAMQDCGRLDTDRESMLAAAEWLLSKQVREPGDWSLGLKNVEPGGWAFEMANRHYPDMDDTAVVMLALRRMAPEMSSPVAVNEAIDRGRRWLIAMQSRNGGWGAFDRNNTNRLVTKIPFCDYGEVLDPPSVDVTAHIVETLNELDEMSCEKQQRCLDRAMSYLLSEQERDGSWFGRWGVNHVYGVGAVLPALAAAGRADDPRAHRAAEWLVARQNSDGGWGETPGSYMDESLRGRGESTPSQTAWAMMGLLALTDGRYNASIRRGADFLIGRQRGDGTWDEPQFTGTGFPGYGVGERRDLSQRGAALDHGVELERGFMINYNLYRHYFPMMALGRFAESLRSSG